MKIGISENHHYSKLINAALKKYCNEANQSDCELLFISKNNFSSLQEKNILLDVLISFNPILFNVSPILSDSCNILINADSKNCLRIQNGSFQIITFGYSQKACVTFSSYDANRFQYCIQRAFKTQSGKNIYPQEFPVDVLIDEKNIYSEMAAVTAALVLDWKRTS